MKICKKENSWKPKFFWMKKNICQNDKSLKRKFVKKKIRQKENSSKREE